jgi:hypothetical protein
MNFYWKNLLVISAILVIQCGGFSYVSVPKPFRTRAVIIRSAGLAQRMLNYALDSPLYEHLLVPQARATMVKTARANGIPWEASLEWISKGALPQGGWDDALSNVTDSDTQTPAYYRQPFHAYLKGGNLCWEAAWEQELAGNQAVNLHVLFSLPNLLGPKLKKKKRGGSCRCRISAISRLLL